VSQAGSDGLIVRARVVMGSSRTRASYTRCQRSRAALERALAQPRRTAAAAHRAARRRLAAAATGHLPPATSHPPPASCRAHAVSATSADFEVRDAERLAAAVWRAAALDGGGVSPHCARNCFPSDLQQQNTKHQRSRRRSTQPPPDCGSASCSPTGPGTITPQRVCWAR
jgi:hypothetical protein